MTVEFRLVEQFTPVRQRCFETSRWSATSQKLYNSYKQQEKL